MTGFFESLFSEGRVRLSTTDAPSPADLSAAVEWILAFEPHYRRTLAGTPPAPDAAAVGWAARVFFRAAQLLVARNIGAAQVLADLSVPCPRPPEPAVCYGVDLTWRFLPDLVRIARAASQNDPLVERLLAWCGEWPLSSVGVPDVTAGPLDGFVGDPALRMLYVDRIISTGDVSRLNDLRVREAVRSALGAFPRLAPSLAAALATETAHTDAS
jgi:hypothetical protein